MHLVKFLALSAALSLSGAAAWADGPGLNANADQSPWARFQGRIAYSGTINRSWRDGLVAPDNNGIKLNAISVMGDLYFGAAPNGGGAQTGGFRATSGIVSGARGALWGTSATAPSSGLFSVDRRLFGQSPSLLPNAGDTGDTATVPYVGIGYSSLASRGGWSFSADLGLVSLTPAAAVRLGRVFGSGQNLDDMVRDMRLTPVLQLGASYSF